MNGQCLESMVGLLLLLFMYWYYFVGNTLVIAIEGDLLGAGVEPQVQKLAYQYCPKLTRHIIVDLSQINHLNSVGLSLLLKILTRVRNEGGEMVIVRPKEKAYKILAITKLDKIFIMASSKTEALKSFTPKSASHLLQGV